MIFCRFGKNILSGSPDPPNPIIFMIEIGSYVEGTIFWLFVKINCNSHDINRMWVLQLILANVKKQIIYITDFSHYDPHFSEYIPFCTYIFIWCKYLSVITVIILSSQCLLLMYLQVFDWFYHLVAILCTFLVLLYTLIVLWDFLFFSVGNWQSLLELANSFYLISSFLATMILK